MKTCLRLTILAMTVAIAASLVCFPKFCDPVKCTQITEDDCKANGQMFKANGTFCGCCDTCLDIIPLGGDCSFWLLNIGFPPIAVCTTGTTCTQIGNSMMYLCL